MPFVVVSNGPTRSDAFRVPRKTICNPEPDGPSSPRTTKVAQSSTEAPKPVSSSLTYPLEAALAVDLRVGCLGCGRALPWLKTAGSGLEQTCQKRILDAFPVGSGAPYAYRRATRDAPGPRWLV